MARARLQPRHPLPGSGSKRMPRNGAAKGRQVYRCGNCKRYYTHGAAYTHPSAAGREPNLAPLGESISQSAIARIVGVTPPAVCRWVKKRGLPHSPGCGAGAGSNGNARRSTAGGVDFLCWAVDLSASKTWGQAARLRGLAWR